MKFKNPPYIFAIPDEEVTVRNWHALIAQRLTAGGFDVGIMLWTANPHIFGNDEIKQFWAEALTHAGIARMEMGSEPAKHRTWFKVWRKETV